MTHIDPAILKKVFPQGLMLLASEDTFLPVYLTLGNYVHSFATTEEGSHVDPQLQNPDID